MTKKNTHSLVTANDGNNQPTVPPLYLLTIYGILVLTITSVS